MSPALQTTVALALAAMAAAGLVWRWLAKRNKPGCGGSCGCPGGDLKEKLKH